MLNLEKTWQIKVRQQHEVKMFVNEGFFSDKLAIYVDGKLRFEKQVGYFSLKGQRNFFVNSDDWTIEWKWKLSWKRAYPKYVTLKLHDRVLAEYTDDMREEAKQAANETAEANKEPVPRWAWIFMGACGLIPVVSLGGAIPALIGFLGASIVRKISLDSSRSVSTNVAYCAGTTLLTWVGFGFTMIILGNLFAPFLI